MCPSYPSFVWCLLMMLVLVGSARAEVSCSPRPSYCNQEIVGSYSPCPSSSALLSCNYSKQFGNETIPTADPCSMNIPDKPFNISWSFYNFSNKNSCSSAINITWMLPQLGSAQHITGFRLNYTFIYPNGYRIDWFRTFNVGPVQYAPQRNTLFYYDCFQVIPNGDVVHRVSIQSLPATSPYSRVENNNITFISVNNPTGSNVSPATCTDTWKALAAVSPSDIDSLIDVTFDPAPACYGFTAYYISLVDYSSGVMYLVVQRVKKTPTNEEPIRHRFTTVCPMTYRIMIRPLFNDTCECLRPDDYGSGLTCDRCPVTEISPVYMNRSKCSSDNGPPFDDNKCPSPPPPPTPTPPTPPESPMSTAPNSVPPVSNGSTSNGSAPGNNTLGTGPMPVTPDEKAHIIIGAVTGCVLSAIVITIIAIVIFRYRHYKEEDVPDEPPPPINPKILLAYFDDNEEQFCVVQRLATFLESQTVCTVILDRWSSEAAREASLVDHIRQQVAEAAHIVLVNPPEKRIRLINDGKQGAPAADCSAVEGDTLSLVFSNLPYNCTLHTVCFNNPRSRFADSTSVWRTGRNVYKLMKDVDKLLADVFQQTRVGDENHTDTPHGRELRTALDNYCRTDSGYWPSIRTRTDSMPSLTSVQTVVMDDIINKLNDAYDESCGIIMSSMHYAELFVADV